MSLTLWRSVRAAHAGEAFSGEGAALFPGRYNAPGVRAVYLADCPAGCALELVASYAAPEAIATHLLFEVEVDADLVDLRAAAARKRYGVGIETLVAPDDYDAPRRVAARLLEEKRAGAIVPAATVARAFNVVIYPDLWNGFAVRGSQPLALDRRVFDRLGSGLGLPRTRALEGGAPSPPEGLGWMGDTRCPAAPAPTARRPPDGPRAQKLSGVTRSR